MYSRHSLNYSLVFISTFRRSKSKDCKPTKPFCLFLCYEIKNNGTGYSLHHMRLCCKHRNDSRLPATSHHHHTHPQYRRHCPTHLPYDGHRSIRLYAARVASPPQHNLVNVHHQCCHLYVQLHNLYNQDIQQEFTQIKDTASSTFAAMGHA